MYIRVCVSFILSLVRSNLADPRLHRLYPFSLPLHFPLYAFLCIDLRPCVFLDRTADRERDEFAEHRALDTRRLPDNECFSSFFSPRRVKADNNYHGSSVFRLDNDSSLPVPIYPFGNVPLSKRGIDRPRSSTFPILFLGSRNRSRLSPLPDYLIQLGRSAVRRSLMKSPIPRICAARIRQKVNKRRARQKREKT